MFELIKKQSNARRGRLTTVNGVIETPVFMNVATAGAIKGAVSSLDLKELGCQVMLSNTYHLHVRPGDEIVKQLGGVRKMTRWDGPVLTDSGGFQVFSLAKLRNIKEEGVYFSSHVDGRKIFMGPEESMRIQSNLGSTIAMAFDECVENPAEYRYALESAKRTTRWLERCKIEHDRLNALDGTLNKKQLLFGINQGCTYDDIRIEHMKEIAKLESYALTDKTFSGFIRYETRFTGPAQKLEITDAYEAVEVFVNGKSAGIQVVPPFRFDLRGLAQDGENTLVIEIATTLERERGDIENAAPTGITGKVALYL